MNFREVLFILKKTASTRQPNQQCRMSLFSITDFSHTTELNYHY